MKSLHIQQKLPISMEEAWSFFSSPKNLNEITPKNMSFEILTQLPETMYEGLLIGYKIRPFLNIPMRWVTEITHIADQQYFIDEQRFGPYKLWHHEHHFEEIENGVLMTDLLHYDVGMGFLGKIAGALYVHQAVAHIFEYRYKVLVDKFGIYH